MKKQVDKEAYTFGKYFYLDRWSSYFCQIKESLDLKPKSILEVGIGDGVFGSYVKSKTNIQYKTLDIANDLNPDFIGSVDKIPIGDNSYDLVCIFEVLEHLPFDKFEESLKELKRVSKKNVIISIPHFGPPVKVKFKIPFLPEIKFAFKIPFPIEHEFNGQHYWELGKKRYSSRRIRRIINKHFKILKEFIPFDSQYHHFYVLEKS
jgi:ubiquinone/menaquinone biosynthesis C-methylase UbiE